MLLLFGQTLLQYDLSMLEHREPALPHYFYYTHYSLLYGDTYLMQTVDHMAQRLAHEGKYEVLVNVLEFGEGGERHAS